MRTYFQLAAAGFQRYSTYRMAIAAGVITQSVFGFIRVSVMLAAVAAGTTCLEELLRVTQDSGDA